MAAFGCPSVRWPGVWACDGDVPPIFLQAIVQPGATSPAEQSQELQAYFARRPATSALTIVDYRNALDLRPLGLVREAPRACYWSTATDGREPVQPPELEILDVRSPDLLRQFEHVSAQGFEASLPPGGWHPPAVLEDPRFRVWIGRVTGQPVGAAMAYVGDDVVGVYGVAVIPSARRRGYAAALTWRAMRGEGNLPVALQPSDMAAGMYRSLGFAPIGESTPWHRPPGG